MSSTGRGGVKLDQDKYYTPIWCVEKLISKIHITEIKSFLEPCKGDGRILTYIPTDITRDWCELSDDKDYLTFIPSMEYDLIITNPPFSLSIEFLTKSLKEAKTVCYLQRLNWLGSKTRKDFWNTNTPDKLFILSQRPQFMKEMGLKSGSDSTEYAWFIWDKLGIVNGKHIEIL
jgi:hypothetical protein